MQSAISNIIPDSKTESLSTSDAQSVSTSGHVDSIPAPDDQPTRSVESDPCLTNLENKLKARGYRFLEEFTGFEAANDDNLLKLKQTILSMFPVTGLSVSWFYGPRFVTVINGDLLTDHEFDATVERFETINLWLMEFDKHSLFKALGKSFGRAKTRSAVGSLIVVASSSRRAGQLRQLLASAPLRNDNLMAQFKDIFWRWDCLPRLLFGRTKMLITQLRQEIVVLDSASFMATSTASCRATFEFGFSLRDIAAS